MEWIWIPVAAIIAWAAVSIAWSIRGSGGGRGRSDELRRAIEDNTATNKALLAKLDTIDTRLTAVEKTLNDIP